MTRKALGALAACIAALAAALAALSVAVGEGPARIVVIVIALVLLASAGVLIGAALATQKKAPSRAPSAQ